MSTILGERPSPAAEASRRRIHVAGLLVVVLCAHISMLAPQRSLNTTQTFQRGKSFSIASYPIFFFHHYDRNRWFASLATTVDNTIKMMERSFKHGRPWCIRRVGLVFCTKLYTKWPLLPVHFHNFLFLLTLEQLKPRPWNLAHFLSIAFSPIRF